MSEGNPKYALGFADGYDDNDANPDYQNWSEEDRAAYDSGWEAGDNQRWNEAHPDDAEDYYEYDLFPKRGEDM